LGQRKLRTTSSVAAEAGPKVFALILKHEDVIQLADAVINAWRQQLGHDVEDDGLP
jgi:hypothetical protein